MQTMHSRVYSMGFPVRPFHPWLTYSTRALSDRQKGFGVIWRHHGLSPAEAEVLKGLLGERAVGGWGEPGLLVLLLVAVAVVVELNGLGKSGTHRGHITAGLKVTYYTT